MHTPSQPHSASCPETDHVGCVGAASQQLPSLLAGALGTESPSGPDVLVPSPCHHTLLLSLPIGFASWAPGPSGLCLRPTQLVSGTPEVGPRPQGHGAELRAGPGDVTPLGWKSLPFAFTVACARELRNEELPGWTLNPTNLWTLPLARHFFGQQESAARGREPVWEGCAQRKLQPESSLFPPCRAKPKLPGGARPSSLWCLRASGTCRPRHCSSMCTWPGWA